MDRDHTSGTIGRRYGRRWARLCVLGFTLMATSTALPARAVEDGAAPPHIRGANESLTQYRAFRRMHARSDKFKQEGWLDAWTEFDGRTFRYEIVSERGSDYVRNKVLKAVLKREQELVARGAGRAALTEDNYTFGEAERDADGLRYIPLKPKRDDVVLVEGRMVLSPDGGDLLRVEGRLAKNPSFWTSMVNIIRHFASVDGVRVPVATESVAKIRFAGKSRLDVYYEYESINGRPVSTAARMILASNAAAGTR